MSNPMEKSGTKASPLQIMKRPKQGARSQQPQQAEKVSDSDTRHMLEKKLSEINALHEAIFDEHNRLIQENVKLSQELAKVKLENAQAIIEKDKDIEELKKEVNEQCEKLERDINDVELLIKRNKELEEENKMILERDFELNRQLSELQERLVNKDKIIRLKTTLVQNKQKDITILKEKTEQLLHIYEKSMKNNLRDISDMCAEICNQPSTTQDDPDEMETTV